MASDGQVTMGNTVVKATARKVRRLHDGKVLAGFAGSAADGLTLFEKFEAKLKDTGGNLLRAAVELAKDWRIDRALRRLEAMLLVADREQDPAAVGHRRRHRARRRRRRGRLGRQLRARPPPAPCWRTPRSRPARSPSRRWTSPATSASTPTASTCSRSCEPMPIPMPPMQHAPCPRHLPARRPSLTPRAIVEELDRYIVGQTRRQARGGRGPAQPLAPPAGRSPRCATRSRPRTS